MMPRVLRRCLGRHLMFTLGLGIVLVMTLAALFAPFIAPYDPTQEHGHAVLIGVLKELVGQHPGDGVPCKGDFRLIGPVDDLKLQHLPEHRGQVVQKVSIHR